MNNAELFEKRIYAQLKGPVKQEFFIRQDKPVQESLYRLDEDAAAQENTLLRSYDPEKYESRLQEVKFSIKTLADEYSERGFELGLSRHKEGYRYEVDLESSFGPINLEFYDHSADEHSNIEGVRATYVSLSLGSKKLHWAVESGAYAGTHDHFYPANLREAEQFETFLDSVSRISTSKD